MNKKMMMPASYTALDESEMTYIDGGAGIETFLLTTVAIYAAAQFVPKILASVITSIRNFFISYKPTPLE